MTWSFVRKGKAAKDLVIESHGSSIGSQWINEFYWSARGESAEDWLDELQSRRAKLSWPPVKIVFPSLKTVRDSVPGEQGGETIFCRKNHTGGRILMHTKIIIATYLYLPNKSIFETSNQSKGKEKELSDSETEPDSESDIEI
ncbi:hypothetical protein BD769DRAFT_1676561 [Suillus cothurnatus]|nr:hypothetical protein BD769DRAFT_1676561 [Suillus cothurnatus]